VRDTRRQVKVHIRGAVQGVGYRAWTFARARQLHLAGYVRNCANGDVEAVFVGAAASVSAMVDECWKGPPMAQVAAVDVEEIGRGAAAGYVALQDFSISPTH
jgi:acylphosphatase